MFLLKNIASDTMYYEGIKIDDLIPYGEFLICHSFGTELSV